MSGEKNPCKKLQTDDILYDVGRRGAPADQGRHVGKNPTPTVKNQDTGALERLKAILRGRRDWLTAAQITRLSASHDSPGWDRRYIAELAKLANGEILGSGHGYKLADKTTTTSDDVLLSYTTTVRKAIGTELTARKSIAWARRHGILTDQRSDDQLAADIQSQVRQEIAKAPPDSPQRPIPLGQGQVEQADLFRT